MNFTTTFVAREPKAEAASSGKNAAEVVAVRILDDNEQYEEHGDNDEKHQQNDT